MRPRVQPAPARATGKLQDSRKVAHRPGASTPTYAERLAAQWCRDIAALVGELRALRRDRRRV